MKVLIALFLLNTSVFTQSLTEKHIKRLKSLKEITPKDLVHENDGCPENSKCSKQNGLKRKQWLRALDQYEKTNKAKYLNNFINKYGHPTSFLIKEKNSTSLDPIIFSSRCQSHKKENIVEASLFLKSIPKNLNLHFNSIKTNYGSFKLPYRTRPLGFKDSKAIVILEYNSTLYTTLISRDFKITIIDLKAADLDLLIEKKTNNKCIKKNKLDSYFFETDCFKVWDLTKKKLIQVTQTANCI